MSNKKFLDAVHGYISVPESYCEKIVDTIHFQRLRRIEQTSSRSLFPCAHHDRFVHSLGVFHIGQKIVNTISNQLEVNEGIKQSFLIACLLHDCGHSPFSHTFEHLFGTNSELFERCKNELKNHNIDEPLIDYNIEKSDAKPHEIISALLALTVYFEAIIDLGGNPAFVARMIIGALYNTTEKSLEDCFISLLHSDVIDADKLDYVCRDKWASGYLSNSVDLDRLISSIHIYKNNHNKYIVSFQKSAINEIQSVIDSKNFQQIWVFKHHQVVYEQYLLEQSVEELITKLDPDNGDAKILFNVESFFKKIDVKTGISLYLPTDDDLIHLLKSNIDVLPHAKEWLSRKYSFFPLWKSRAEFLSNFKSQTGINLLSYKEKNLFDEIIMNFFAEKYGPDSVIILNGNPKFNKILKDQIKIKFNSVVVDYVDLNYPAISDVYSNSVFKYVYVNRDYFDEKENILTELTAELKKIVEHRRRKRKK